MGRVRIYSSGPLVSGQTQTLASGASRHVSRVLRLGAGDPITLFDGSGIDYAAEIIAVARDEVQVRIGTGGEAARESPLPVTLLQGVSRPARMDMVIQKATELGVTAIQPVLTERSVVRLDGERIAARVAHWRAIAIGACEQCGRSVLPRIQPPLPLKATVGMVPAGGIGLVLDPDADTVALRRDGPPARVLLAIGPEGGFSPEETATLTAAGWHRLRLGPRILRTETAPIAALSVLQFAWGDLGGKR